MKLINSCLFGNYEREALNFSFKKFNCGLMIFIIIFSTMIFKLEFIRHKSFLLERKDSNMYQVLITYQDMNLFMSNNKFYYDGKNYNYSIKTIDDKNSIIDEGKVYLPFIVEIDNIDSLPLIEILIKDDKMTLINYLKTWLEEV